MRQVWWMTGLALGLAGCISPLEERCQDYVEDGVNLFRHGDYYDARESFQAALALRPDDPGLLYDIGQCFDRLGDAGKAERFYRECVQHAPNHAPCRHALDVLLVRHNRQTEAARLIEGWLAQEPRLAAAYAEDGWYWRQTGDLPRAQARLQQALEFDPHDLQALTELALVYEAMQRPDRALVLYERALERDPKQPELAGRVNFLLTKGAVRPTPE
jgi:Flp pilus assembly protein TadD